MYGFRNVVLFPKEFLNNSNHVTFSRPTAASNCRGVCQCSTTNCQTPLLALVIDCEFL